MEEFEEKEKNEYSKKLETQINAITEILNLNTCGLISDKKRKTLEQLREQAGVLKRKIDTGEFEIAVIGLEKSGKSTFANAIMQNDILPSDNERCTYTSASIEYSSEGASAVVEIMTEEDFYEGFNEKIKAIGFKNRVSLPDITTDGYTADIKKLEEELKKDNRKINKNLNEDILNIIKNKDSLLNLCRGPKKLEFFGEQLDTEEFKNLICSPDQAVAVKRITIKTNQFKGMQNAVLYDVPGFDSPTTLHKKQTKEFMNKADAIVLVSRANEPSFKETETNLFDDYKNETDDDETVLADKMFPFANKVDIIEPNKGRTWNEQLNRNIDVLKGELRKYINFTKTDRIVVGSALKSLKQEPMGRGVSDGVEEIKQKLEDYYQNERFEILKRRVTSYQKRIKEECDELKELISESISESSLEDYGKILQDLQSTNVVIKEKLEDYRTYLKSCYNSDHIISKEVEEIIVAGISKDIFKVTAEEMTRAINADDPTTSDASKPEKIETYLRKKKFEELYNKFSSGIIELAEKHHEKSDNDIKTIFRSALTKCDVICNNDVENVIDEYVNAQKDTSTGMGYYQSLVERFTRDLFEILIGYNFGYPSRWNKYNAEREVFDSLAMFDQRKIHSISVEKQPLFYSILFHDEKKYESYNIVSSILADIQKVFEFVPTQKIIDLVTNLVFTGETAEQIKRKYNSIKGIGSSKETALEDCLTPQKQNDSSNVVIPQFNVKVQTSNTKEREKPIPDDLTEKSYNDYFSNKLNKGNEKIKSDIETDIEILHNVIKNVVVRAIRIEKPFLALQFRNISKLIASLDDKVWKDFVRNNLCLFRAAEYSKLSEKEQQRAARKGIMEQIDKILNQMNSNSTVRKKH